ncbi:MAG: HD-GYP domain-containing protein [Nitrospirota bacterium]
MVKKVKVERLKPGMYIHDLNCSWMDHPFFGSSLSVKNQVIIDKIIRFGIREVYIDTEKGLDVEDETSGEEKKAEEGKTGVHDRHEDIALSEDINFDDIKPVPVRDEILRAKLIREEALQTVQKAMRDIKAGNQIEKHAVVHTVDDILVSICRNKNALAGFRMLKNADEYLYNHSINVCTLMVSFGKFLGFDSQLLREIGIGALLHDIGTMRIPQSILSKKSALTDEEYSEVKKHVQYGRKILEETEGIAETSIITAYHHHERLDGSGYPNGLKGDKISYAGQAISIVDVYDALTTKKCYRHKIPPTRALEMIYEWSGTQFSRELVQKFIRCIGIYPVGSLVRLHSGLIGVVINHSEENLLQPVVRVIYNKKAKRHIAVPYDIDLSIEEAKGGAERIEGYELPEELNVVTEMYL